MATKEARINITARDRATGQIARVRQSLLGLRATAMSAAGALTGLGGIASVAGMAMMARSAIQLGSSITDMATATQTGIEELQALTYAAREAGATNDQMAMLLVRVQKSANDASRGLSTARDAFKTLNINAEEFINLSPERMLERVGQSLVAAEGDTRAYGAALDLLGTRNAPKLLEALQRLGKDGFDQLALDADAAGQVMAAVTAKRLDEAADSIERFKTRSTILFGEAIANMMDGSGVGRQILMMQLASLASSFGGRIIDAVIDAWQIIGVAGFAVFDNIARRFGASIAQALGIEFEGLEDRAESLGDAISRAIASTKPLTQFADEFSGYWQVKIDDLKAGMDELKKGITAVGSDDSGQKIVTWIDDAARGVTALASGLENGLLNAAKNGKTAFGDMGRFILAEIQRIIIRAMILRPLFGMIGGMFGDGSAIGGAFSGAFGSSVPGKASGGPVSAGGTYLVGERGPELLTMGGNGHVTPNHELGGSSGPVFNVDMRGADPSTVQRLEMMVSRLNGTLEQRAIGAVQMHRYRNPGFMGA